MTTMRAAVIADGEPGITIADVEVPTNGPGELLVRNHAIGVGIHDSYFLPADFSHPFPIGIEAAGTIERVGENVAGRFRPGDRIAYVSTNQRKGGTWVEYSVVSGDSLIIAIPDEMGFDRAAAVPVAGNTALRALHALPSIARPDTMFIAGASGAVGTFAVQLGSARGWEVAASASARNHGYLSDLGAAKTVDYHDPAWTDELLRWRPDGFAGAIAIQPGTSAQALEIVRRGGTVVTVSGDRVDGARRGVTVRGIAYDVDVRGELDDLLRDIQSGAIHLEIERIYPFEEAAVALAKVQTRRARGKVVLTVP